jgi:hypothetical protein
MHWLLGSRLLYNRLSLYRLLRLMYRSLYRRWRSRTRLSRSIRRLVLVLRRTGGFMLPKACARRTGIAVNANFTHAFVFRFHVVFIVLEPKLLILDEPTAGVDIELRRSMWGFLKDLNDKGTTIILTTHYLEEAEMLCRNIGIIQHGELVENTSMKDLLSKLKSETFILDLAAKSPLPKLEAGNINNALKYAKGEFVLSEDRSGKRSNECQPTPVDRHVVRWGAQRPGSGPPVPRGRPDAGERGSPFQSHQHHR